MINVSFSKFNNKLWFVTGDSQKTKRRICAMYNKTYVYTTAKAKHYDRCRADSTTIIEHEILAKSRYMIISKSTFWFNCFTKIWHISYGKL